MKAEASVKHTQEHVFWAWEKQFKKWSSTLGSITKLGNSSISPWGQRKDLRSQEAIKKKLLRTSSWGIKHFTWTIHKKVGNLLPEIRIDSCQGMVSVQLSHGNKLNDCPTNEYFFTPFCKFCIYKYGIKNKTDSLRGPGCEKLL